MNTKYFLLFLCLSALTLSSCGGDDDSKSSSIKYSLVGTWETSMSSSNWRTIHISTNGGLRDNYLSKKDLESKYTYDEEKKVYYYIDYVLYGTGSGGSGVHEYRNEYDPSDNAHWVYNETDNTISMFTDDGYYAFTYKVTFSDDRNSWAGVDAQGKTVSFIRVDD